MSRCNIEYKIVQPSEPHIQIGNPDKFVEFLNEHGAEGWKLDQIQNLTYAPFVQFVFSREK